MFVRWDFVCFFPARELQPGADRTGKEAKDRGRADKRRDVVRALTNAGLMVSCFRSVKQDAVVCKISATDARLKEEAIRTKYQMQLPREPPFSGAWAEYKHDGAFVRLLPLRTLNYQTHQKSVFRHIDRMRLIKNIVQSKTTVGGANLDVSKLLNERHVLHFYALHDQNKLDFLIQEWARWGKLFSEPPFDSIRHYFGEHIALYFAFFNFYTVFLIPLAILGLTMFVWHSSNSLASFVYVDSVFKCIVGVLTCIWCRVFFKCWARRNSCLSVRWGTHTFQDTESIRPQYWGLPRLSPVDDRMHIHFPREQRCCRYLLSFTVTIALAVGVSIAVFAMLVYRSVFDSGNSTMSSIVAGILNGCQIFVLNFVYRRLAVLLNNFENHKTESEFENALIIKLFLFQFINSFSSSFYIIYIKENVNYFGVKPNSCVPVCVNTHHLQCRHAVTCHVFIPLIELSELWMCDVHARHRIA